jgi:hypothetical protein
LFRIDLADGVEGHVGLNRGFRGEGAINLNPVVGVAHIAIEEELAKRTGRAGDQATVGSHIGYLLPVRDYVEYVISDPETANEVVQSIRDAVRDFALPWMRDRVDLAVVALDMAAGRYSYQSEIDYHLPLILRDLGRRAEAVAWLDEARSRYDPAGDISDANYLRFASNLRAELAP